MKTTNVVFGKVRDVRDYAALAAELSAGGEPTEILQRWGLSEEDYEAVEATYQQALSDAMDATAEGVPPLVAEYAAAFAAARAKRAASPGDGSYQGLDLETFARATKAIERLGDVDRALRELGIDLRDYLAASQHWAPRIVADPALAERFLRVEGR